MTELKPCPFCGFQHPTTIESGGRAYVECPLCGAGTSSRETEEEAMAAWNARAERTCHPVEKFTEDSPWPVMVCSECRRPLHYDEHREMDYQPYCGCGAKVVE